jgi:hypothetical protein
MRQAALVCSLCLAPLAAQTITEIRLRVEPADRTIRPGESAVIQQRSYGKVTDSEGVEKSGRIQAPMGNARAGGGWLSKPFLHQGKDDEPFLQTRTGWQEILSRGVGQYTVKDSVLYTAPEKEGTYRVEIDANGLRQSVDIIVSNAAPPRRPPEQVTFPPAPPSRDPYRKLVERYAPFVAQETWFQPKSDYLARFDYDNDWDGGNNWENIDKGTSQAYVHYAVMETDSHWFLHYNFFHARDYSDNCVVGTCHENDNEGLILAVRKDGSEFGKLEAMETLAHDNIYSFAADRGIRNGVHDIDGAIALHDGSHPVVFIEAGGHGVLGGTARASIFDPQRMDFRQNTGVTYVYKGVAERPKHANDRLVGYDLLPIYEEWWTKARQNGWPEKTFDAFYTYMPLGGRPGIASGTAVGGAFYGRAQAANKAKPFWGWHDKRTKDRKVLGTGQWGLDPAYAMSRNLTFPPGPYSLTYTFNPYLDDRSTPPAQVGARAATTPAPVARGEMTQPARGDAVPVEPAANGWGDPAPRATPGTCELETRVDGVVRIAIRGSAADFRTVSGEPASETSARCSAALPEAPGWTITVDRTQGRGKVSLEQAPDAANGFEAIVRIDDPARGADRYRAVLKWSATPAPSTSRQPGRP